MEAGTLIDVVVLVGTAVVLPLALGHLLRWWVATAAVVASLLLPVGLPAAVVAGVWAVVACTVLWSEGGELRDRTWRSLLADPPVRFLAAGFAVVAASAMVASRGGVVLFEVREPVVELTAVHFTYAGAGALILAGAAARDARRPAWGRGAIALTLVAPPVVALGFVTGEALPQVGGAVLMTLGVWLTAALQVAEATRAHTWDRRRVLLLVSGFAPWVPMVLAVCWAASNHWVVPALSIPDMARTHGVLQVVFVIAGLWARRALASTRVVDPLATVGVT